MLQCFNYHVQYLSLVGPSGAGHSPNVAILVCLVQQLPPVSSSSRCPVILCPGFVSMCSWVFLSCDVHLASNRETVWCTFHLFTMQGPAMSILFSSTELIWVLVQTFSINVHHYLTVLAT